MKNPFTPVKLELAVLLLLIAVVSIVLSLLQWAPARQLGFLLTLSVGAALWVVMRVRAIKRKYRS